MQKRRKLNPATVDWSLSNKELAEIYGVTQPSISYHRRRISDRAARRSKYRIDWSSVDWTKSNSLIALEYSITPSPVCQARAKYAPEHLKKSPRGFRLPMTRTSRKATANTKVEEGYPLIVPAIVDDTLPTVPAPTPEPAPAPKVGWFRRVVAAIFGFNVTVEGNR